MSVITREVKIKDRTIKFEFNKFAKQANGSVMVSCEDTQVLVTVCATEKSNPDLDFFPLGVDYIEKFYAAGRVPGGYLKREGKPSDQSALNARLIDRPIRPLFPKSFKNETVVTATVMSYSHGVSPVPLAMVGASTAFMISDIPFNTPIAGLKIGLKDGKYIIDPTEGSEGENDLDLTIACSPDAVLMVEAGAKELSEEKMLEAINYAHEKMQPLFDMQKEVQETLGKKKWETPEEKTIDTSLINKVTEIITGPLEKAFSIGDKKKRSAALSEAVKETINKVCEEISDKTSSLEADIKKIASNLKSKIMRSMVLNDKKRIDGRGLEDIRQITCEVGTLKRPHGSSLFTRGETQALATVTLAAEDDQQRGESLWNNQMRDDFMLHYNFPPFSVGEARMQRHPGRREIGHGKLARRALLPVLPSKYEYTLRLVSETLESNGSSSMAAVCSGTMAMLHAGVPLKDSVAGIAMGLIKEGDKYSILSDILGDEDHLGDMDFKVCGTKKGITALQMDIKIGGLSSEVMLQALEQAKRGRKHILEIMETTISEPAPNNKAPKKFKLKIDPAKIKDIIGPGGKVIKKITADTNVKMDVDDNGIISVLAQDSLSAQAAKDMIRSYLSKPEVGTIFIGTIKTIVEFGVFVEIREGLDGLCHISQLDEDRIEDITKKEEFEVGKQIAVKIVEIDRQGRIKLSRIEALKEKTLSGSK